MIFLSINYSFLKNRLVDEYGVVTPIPLQPSQQYDYCIGICIEPDRLVACDFHVQQSFLRGNRILVPDSMLHLSHGSFSTSFTTSSRLFSTWTMEMTYRIWNASEEILLFQMKQDNQVFKIVSTSCSLLLYLNHQCLYTFTSDHCLEGEWCSISIQKTTHDLHCHWNDQSNVIFNQYMFQLSLSCSIHVGNNQSEWDLLSLTIQSLEHTLYNFEFLYTFLVSV